MLGPYSAYPILKGWDYRLYTGSRTVKRGETVEIVRVSETGLLLAFVLTTTDAYGAVILEAQGAELRNETQEYAPEDFFVGGAVSPDPVGYLIRYFRPNPASTAGLYILEIAPGFWGLPLPFVPSVVVKLRLQGQSTQSQAEIFVQARAINVANKASYIQSIRRLLDPKADLTVDPEFMTVGPVQFKEAKK